MTREDNPRLRFRRRYLDGLEEFDRDVLTKMLHRKRGQLAVRDQGDVLMTIKHLARLLPKARIAVAVSTRSQASTIRRGLINVLEKRVDYSHGIAWTGKTRCRVCTFQSLETCDPSQVEVVVVPHGVDALGEHVSGILARFPQHLVFGFVRTDELRGDQESHARLDQAIGPEIARFPSQADWRAKVTVLVCRAVECTSARTDTVLEYKRKMIWHNGPRNDAIAAVATAFVEKDFQTLARHGLQQEQLPLLDGTTPRFPAVAILVEGTEHAKQLLPRLPGWTISARLPRELEDDEEAAVKVPLNSHLQIVTAVQADAMGVQADIVIFGTGRRWPPRIRDFPRELRQDTGDQQYLVDFADDFSEQGNQDFEARRDEYKLQHWTVMDPDSDPDS